MVAARVRTFRISSAETEPALTAMLSTHARGSSSASRAPGTDLDIFLDWKMRLEKSLRLSKPRRIPAPNHELPSHVTPTHQPTWRQPMFGPRDSPGDGSLADDRRPTTCSNSSSSATVPHTTLRAKDAWIVRDGLDEVQAMDLLPSLRPAMGVVTTGRPTPGYGRVTLPLYLGAIPDRGVTDKRQELEMGAGPGKPSSR